MAPYTSACVSILRRYITLILVDFEVNRKANEKKEKEFKMTAKDGEFQQEFENNLNHTILSEVASIKLFFQK